MPYRARRHQLEGSLVYHIWNRSNRRLEIFHDEEDHERFKSLLQRYSEEKDFQIYHYCIMSNHYHILVEIKDPERLSSIMAGINRVYTAYYHKKYKTAGYLWQGRFKSKPIQKDSYLLGCGRYIERNPVVSKIVQRAEEYSYSSARYYVLGKTDSVITEDPLYGDFGVVSKDRKENYRKFLLDFDKENTDSYTNDSSPLGSNDFRSKFQKKDGRFVPKRKGKPRKAVFSP